MSQPNQAKVPGAKFQGVGHCLLPGEPGYDEALKRIQEAKKAREEQQQQQQATEKPKQ